MGGKMLDRDSIFGDFSDEAFSRGMCKLITQKTLSLLQYHKTRHEDFQKILNPYANQKILDDIKIKVFDDFDEQGVANGVDRLIDTILREHLFYYPKSKAINPLVLGDFSEEAIINAVTQIIDERILASFIEIPINTQSQPKKQTTYNSTNANQYVYILYNEILYQEYNTHIYKIGWTSRTPQIRAAEISQGTGVVGKWKVGHQWKVEDGHWLEQEIFKHFAQYRLPYSEQFNFKGQTLEKVAEQISRFINNHGESPKRAVEIAEKLKQQEREHAARIYQEELKEIEIKNTYDKECKKIKDEIDQRVYYLIQKEIEPIELKQKENRMWFYIPLGFFFIPYYVEDGKSWIAGIILGVFVSFIVGFVLSVFFQKDDKQKAIREKYTKYQNLPNDLQKLKTIKNELFHK
ncbi:GIY-YIG nuclease family protein [Acinetobacter cumulans]|nr:GIY-YIG nuclease family protein [Acinetobacter cumulans]